MTDISKEELHAYTESNNKIATALEKISGFLEIIVEKQDKIMDKFENGFTSDIKDCKNILTETKTYMTDLKTSSSNIRNDTIVMKYASVILASGVIAFEIFAKVVEYIKH